MGPPSMPCGSGGVYGMPPPHMMPPPPSGWPGPPPPMGQMRPDAGGFPLPEVQWGGSPRGGPAASGSSAPPPAPSATAATSWSGHPAVELESSSNAIDLDD